MVPADSHRIPRVPRYSGYRQASCRFVYGPVTLCGRTFQSVPLTTILATTRSYNPATAKRRQRFGLLPVRSPLLGESLLFSLPAGTKMFQFPAYAPRAKAGCQPFRLTGCPIRKSADHRSFAPPRGLSQLITSFIAGRSQGIHRTPLSTSHRNGTPDHSAQKRARKGFPTNILSAVHNKCLVYLICLFHSMPKIA